jgi:antirestriction protein ArdC
MARITQSETRREAKLEALQEHLATAVEALVTGEDWLEAMAFAAKFRKHSFLNTLLIHAQHGHAYSTGAVSEPRPSYVAGFRQWEALGRQVQKGQHGYMIQAPVMVRYATSNPTDPATWRRLGHREQPKPGEQVRSRMVGVKPAYVWDVCQTSGDTVPTLARARLLEGEAPAGLWDGLAGLIEAEGYTLNLVDDASAIGGANGRTDYTAKTVSVRTDMDAAARVKTLAHELAHVKMHTPDEETTDSHRGVQEVEAESVAMMVGAAYDLTTDGYTVPYVSSWATTVPDKTPAEVIRATGEKVRTVALGILDALDGGPATG